LTLVNADLLALSTHIRFITAVLNESVESEALIEF
jgi:hypothetical protein